MKHNLILTAPEGVWLGNHASWYRLVYALKRIDEMTPEQLQKLAFDWEGEEEEQDGPNHWMLTRQGDLAFIQVSGPLTSDENPWLRFFGITSYVDVRNAVTAAVEGGAKRGVMIYNSPGGSVSGVSETARFLRMVNENQLPLTSYTGTQMTSGAYWLAAPSEEVVASELSVVGSIGAIGVHTEYTKLLEDIGITARVFRAGKYKALANPYEKLSQLGAEEIQADLNTAYDVFTQQMADFRGLPVEYLRQNAAEGKAFYAHEALPVGLVDRVEGLDSLVSGLVNELEQTTHQGDSTMGVRTRFNTSLPTGQPAHAGGSDQAGQANSPLDTKEEPRPAGVKAEEEEAASQEETSPPVDEGEESKETEEAPSSAARQDSMLYLQIQALQEQLVESRVEVRQLKSRCDQAESAVRGMTPALAICVQRLEVGLGRQEADLTTLSPTMLVDRFNQVNKEFQAAFPVGGKFQSQTEGESPEADTLEAVGMDPRVVSLSRFKR